jgi:hypothetical protein
MVEVGCPVDGCDFSGPVRSVEAHISGSTSGEHLGEVGRRYRQELTGLAERATESNEELRESLATPPSEAGSGASGRQLLVATALFVVVVAFAGSTSAGDGGSVDDRDGDGDGEGLV